MTGTDLKTAAMKQKGRKNGPLVSVIAPSTEQMEMLEEAVNVLHDFEIPFEQSIVAAHRAPKYTLRYIAGLEPKGIQVIIAGAAGSAFLPCLIASLTDIPVIGVPLKGPALAGQDSVVSMLQSGKGVPVATMDIDASYNAGLFACKILSIRFPHLQDELIRRRKSLPTHSI
jgi:5-(carboxyamino)imidazole ribonucleotide mutase